MPNVWVETRNSIRKTPDQTTGQGQSRWLAESYGRPRLGRLAKTAHSTSADLGSTTITHPYHPLRGQQFPILKTRRVASVDTVILKGTAGGTFAVPLAWTDRAEPTPWELLGKNPPQLDVPSLWTLVELLDSLSQQDGRERGA